MLYGVVMSNDHTNPTPEDDGGGTPVEFTATEHKQLCEAVGEAVSAVLGGLPVAVAFHPEDAAFLVEVVGQVAPEAKN